MPTVVVCSADVTSRLLYPVSTCSSIFEGKAMNTPNKKESDKPDDAFVVHRSLRVKAAHDDNSMQMICDRLAPLEGMQKTEIDSGREKISITYNAAQLGFAEIEKTLVDAGYPSAVGWWSRFKAGWYRYLDENAQTNAKSKGGACCSNPSDIYAKRRK
jgi:hypothetical protein